MIRAPQQMQDQYRRPSQPKEYRDGPLSPNQVRLIDILDVASI